MDIVTNRFREFSERSRLQNIDSPSNGRSKGNVRACFDWITTCWISFLTFIMVSLNLILNFLTVLSENERYWKFMRNMLKEECFQKVSDMDREMKMG